MPETLPMTRDAFMNAVQTDQSPDNLLNVLLVRLLTMALTVTRRRPAPARTVGLSVPQGYRGWPVVESTIESAGMRRRLKFYLCPRVAGIGDDEAFPVGTVLVVETARPRTPAEKNYGRGTLPEWALTSVFVMVKYASVYANGNVRCPSDSWGYATFESGGLLSAPEATACGICRLPLVRKVQRCSTLGW